jgi:signal transduction histidine kinase
MKLKKRWNERTRLILTLELAVVLPAAALVILSALHLKSIQRDRAVEAAIQRDFTQVLAISEKQMNAKLIDLADDIRADFPDAETACSASLDHVLATHPYVAHVFVFNPDKNWVFRSQAQRLKDPDFEAEAVYLDRMFDGWMQSEYPEFTDSLVKMEKKGQSYHFSPNYPTRGEKHLYQTTAMFLKPNAATGKPAIVGIVFDAEYLKNEFFPGMLDDVVVRNVSEAQNDKNHAVMMVRAKSESSPLAACTGWDGGAAEVERNMEPVFSGLTLAIKLRGTTLQALGEKFVRTSSFILGGLSLLLAAGLVLTYRNISKEMALARLKSDFVSNVSHELRTPLSLIRLYAETLEMGRLPNPEKQREYFTIIRKESERLTALINNILDFSRIEAGRKEYDFRDTDLSQLVRATLESYRFQIEQNGFTLEEHIAEDLPPVKVDREAIARSLLNLVNNALKYSSSRKFLGINLYRANGSVKLEVVDHGIGIPGEEQNKIFEKFYRVGDPLVHTTKGSGLGLSLVRHIVEAHGGQVAVESTPGEGSTFTISLPVNGSHAANRVSEELSTSQVGG